MMKKLLAAVAAGLFAMGIVGFAQASPMRVSYTATVTEISSRLLGGSVLLGDLVSGYYIYDSTGSTPDVQTWGQNNEWSQTFFENALQDSFVAIGSETFQFFGGFVRTDPNTVGETRYSVYTRGGLVSATHPEINGLAANGLALAFSPYPQTYPLDVIPSDLPPFDPITNPALFYLSFTPLGNDVIVGTLTSVSVESAAPIPEPESYAMLLAGLGLLSFMARRRKQK